VNELIDLRLELFHKDFRMLSDFTDSIALVKRIKVCKSMSDLPFEDLDVEVEKIKEIAGEIVGVSPERLARFYSYVIDARKLEAYRD
jgi:hypothetical protein